MPTARTPSYVKQKKHAIEIQACLPCGANKSLSRLPSSSPNRKGILTKQLLESVDGSATEYVGYKEGGQSKTIRRRPYSVVLLDEVEKVHQAVLNILPAAG